MSDAEKRLAEIRSAIDAIDASVFGSQDRAYVAGLRTLTATIETLDNLATDLDSGGDTWTWRGKSGGTFIHKTPRNCTAAARKLGVIIVESPP